MLAWARPWTPPYIVRWCPVGVRWVYGGILRLDQKHRTKSHRTRKIPPYIVRWGETATQSTTHRTMYGGNFRVRWEMYGGQNRLDSIHRTPTERRTTPRNERRCPESFGVFFFMQ